MIIPATRRYFFIDALDLNDIDFSKVLEASDNLSYRSDGLYFIIKTDDRNYTPATTNRYLGPYDYDQVKLELNKVGWPAEDFLPTDILE
jgi:hypothetical protein